MYACANFNFDDQIWRHFFDKELNAAVITCSTTDRYNHSKQSPNQPDDNKQLHNTKQNFQTQTINKFII